MDCPMIFIELFRTDEKNVTFTDEKDEKNRLKVFKFGIITLDVSDKYDGKNRLVEVEMKFGGTFISISAKYSKTGEKINSIFAIE